MKKYIRICDCCGNTFETDKDNQKTCLFCHQKMLHDFSFWYNYIFRNHPNRWLELDNEFIKLRYGKDIK